MATGEVGGDDVTLGSAAPGGGGAVALEARFELLGLIGRGGMGEVFEARDRQFDRVVAVKRISRGAAKSQRERFELEARVTGQLDHAGIPAVYDRGVLPDGSLFYAMKRIRGRPLSEVIAGCKNLEERLGLVPAVAQVARTIGFAHEHGVLHRDIKPANIILSDHGEVVVLDWGLAKRRSDPRIATDQHTVAGEVIGTPAYMAPEQAIGSTTGIDVHTDVFAIGALLYHVLTGQAPYASGDDSPALVLAAEGRFEPVRRRDPGIPVALAEVCEQAMARDPVRRQGSATQIAVQLEAAVASALRRRAGALDWLTVSLMAVAAASVVVGGLALGMQQVQLVGQGPGLITVGLCSLVAVLLLIVEFATGGRLRLGPLTLAAVLAVSVFSCVNFAAGVASAASTASEMPGDEYLRAMLRGVAEAAGGMVTGGSLGAVLLVLWGAVRWRVGLRGA